MRINIPDLPQLAQTRTSRGISLASDTRGLQTLAASTQAAFQAASNAANEFWKLELQEDENEQLAAAVTKYGAGLDEASNQALAVAPTQARTVFEAAAATAMTDIRGGLTNKQALLRFNLHAAGKYTTRAAEERKLARKRILQRKVFRTDKREQELISIASDINASVQERHQAHIDLFGRDVKGLPVELGLYEKAVLESVYDGADAAKALQDARVQIVRDLAFGYVSQAKKPLEAAMRLEQLPPEFLSTQEESVRSMLDELQHEQREKLLDDLVDRAEEAEEEKVALITRQNEEIDRKGTVLYKEFFNPDNDISQLLRIRDRLEETWPGFGRQERNYVDQVIDKMGTGGYQFAAADDQSVVLAIEELLTNNDLTLEILAGNSDKLTQTKYTTYQTSLRAQNDQGYTTAKILLRSAYSYEQYKSDDSTEGVVRIAQGAYHASVEKLTRYWAGVDRADNEPKGPVTPEQLIKKSQAIIEENRETLRESYLLELTITLAEAAKKIPKLGNLNPADPLADLTQRIRDRTIKINPRVKRLARTLNKYKQQLGGVWQ